MADEKYGLGQGLSGTLKDIGGGRYAQVVSLGDGTESLGTVTPTPVTDAAGDRHEPASNTAAVVTYAAAPGLKHVITGVAWSYSGGDPTGGNLKIEDVSGTTVFSINITAQGAGFIPFPLPKRSAAAGTAMIITLAAGGVGITGKVNVLNHWTEA